MRDALSSLSFDRVFKYVFVSQGHLLVIERR